MITQKQFKSLQNFRIGSWAIWGKERQINSEYFKKQINKLHGSFIFLGLNRSGNKKKPNQNYESKNYGFVNFHSLNHNGDKTLETIFDVNNLKNLKGGYMTDLFNDIEGNSGKIKKNLQETKYAFRILLKQLSIFDKESFKLICFGGDAFKYLASLKSEGTKIKTLEHKIKNIELNVKINKKDVIIKCYKVMHYSYRYNDKYLNETLSNQLLYLNKIS